MEAGKILVVDDSESIREVVKAGISQLGYASSEASNGSEGLDMLSGEEIYNLIITDLNMPHMDGISFVKEVRKLERYKYLPVLILTTESQEQKKLEAKKAGATGWVIKPFETKKLISIIQRLVDQ